MPVLDLSVNDLATLAPTCFKASGVTGIIAGVYTPSAAPTRMLAAARLCQNEGLTLHGWYGFCYFGDSYGEVRDTQWAIENALATGVSRVWIDCETDARDQGWAAAPIPTQEQRVAAIWRCVNLILAAGLEPGIYSGSWWWSSHTDNYTGFSHLPLWNSYYDYDPDPDGLPYGGWTASAVEQYTSSFPCCGRNRDANYIYEEEPMTADEKAALETLIQKVSRAELLLGGHGIDIDDPASPSGHRRIDGEEALVYLNNDGASLPLGQGILQGQMIEVRAKLGLS